MTMDVDAVTDGWYWSRWYGNGGSHGGYLATGRNGVLTDNDDWSFGVRPARPDTTWQSIPVPTI